MRLSSRSATLASRVLARTIGVLFGAGTRHDPLEVFGEHARIIEVGVTDPALAAFLWSHGRSRYLGITARRSRVERAPGAPGGAGPRFWSCPSSRPSPRNNAEVLVLSRGSARRLWSFNDHQHAETVVWMPGPGPSSLVALLGLIKNAVVGRVAVTGTTEFVDARGRGRCYVVVRVRRRLPLARRYISPFLGVAGFLRTLEESGSRYVVLRWFDGLPEKLSGEDIDLLVDDADIETVERILAEHPGTIACDLYSASCFTGTAYKGMAYYPPALARRILGRSIRTEAGFRVPCPEDHFYSLAYHAVYHKGEQSGIPSRRAAFQRAAPPDHDYAAALAALARAIGVEVEITLEGLDECLNVAGWRPPHDMLLRLAAENRWLESTLPSHEPAGDDDWSGLAVFFLRERAVELGLEEAIIDRLVEDGFHVIRRRMLTAEEREAIAPKVRGGDWERGPWPVSGGGPALVVAACDLLPMPPDEFQRLTYPTLDNAWVLVKWKIRQEFDRKLGESRRFNVIHSSDNRLEALYYLEVALPDEVEPIRAEIAALRSRFATRDPVVRTLTRTGRRAKVEVIQYRGGLAVKKTFRPGCERFLEREAFVMKSFSRVLPEIPPLLESGANYLIYPWYANTAEFGPHGLLPLDVVRRTMGVVRFFYERGYSLIDFQPANLLVDRQAGLKVIDFEFLHRYAARPERFEDCYELAGLPEEFDGDRPRWGRTRRGGYRPLWEPRVGLDLASLLEDPLWLQHLRRLRYRVLRHPLRVAVERLRTKTAVRVLVARGRQYRERIRDGVVGHWLGRAGRSIEPWRPVRAGSRRAPAGKTRPEG